MSKKLKIGIIIGIVFCITMIFVILLVFNNKKYTVKFISNGGTIVESQIIKRGNKVVKPIDPTKDGYEFSGWYLDGNKYYFNEKVTNNLRLRAKWTKQGEIEKITVTFDTNGGSTIDNIEVIKGEKITKPSDPTKEGYVFIEWLLNNNKFNFDQDIVSDMKLIASWKKLEEDTFTVTFDSKGGSNIATQTIKKDEKVSKPSDPTKEGYKFSAWYLNNKIYNFNTKITGNITLIASWTPIQADNQTQNNTQQPEEIKYNVVFDSDGGETVNSIEVIENKTITNLPLTKKKDYEFIGWYLGEKQFTTSIEVSSNITLKAKYTHLNSEKQLNDGYPKPDMAYSHSTTDSAQKYLDLLNALWDDEVVSRLNEGFYSQEEIDNYLDWLNNKADKYREVLECLSGYEYMCE